MSKKWYCVHVQVNTENKFVEALKARLKLHPEFEEKVGEIFVPTEEVAEMKAGKKKINVRKLHPGYIFIELDLENEQMHDVMHFIRDIRKGVSFTGHKINPPAIAQADIDRMRGVMKDSTTQPKPKISFLSGELVRVTTGPFANFSGTIQEVDADKHKLKVSVSIFGRPTQVELGFMEVEREG